MNPPSTIAHYKFISKLGEGGMGAVYRATDTKLNRDVAIKVLPAAFAEDSARMARFEREAQVLASLNHPNIAAIYGIEQGAIVMELVEGADLAGPLPVDTALAYARQIAAGLEAAHEKGIVHRDLKPANIKVTPDGAVKLLDFGLAKASEAAPASPNTLSPTLSLSMTQAGMILGTAAYMSPEQARGYSVDRRADIWAFGVVLYEMLTGRQMFSGGETVTDIIAAVVTRDPDWTKLPADTPPHIRRLLERCLRRDVKTRLQAIGEARIALDESPEPPTEPSATVAPPSRRWPWITGIVAAAILGAAVSWWHSTQPAPLRPLMRLNVDLGADMPLSFTQTSTTFDISPDGTRLAVVVDQGKSQTRLGTRLLHQEQVTLLNGTEGAQSPFFSPDGDWIGFFAAGKVKKVAVNGGAPLTLCSLGSLRGASWTDESSIIVASNGGPLRRLPSAGGTPSDFAKLDKDERTHRFPQFLPDHQVVLFTAAGSSRNYDSANIVAQSLKNGARSIVVRDAHAARYLPSGHLLYQHEGTLYAARFDPRRMALAGSPVPVLEDLRDTGFGGALYAASQNGILVFESGRAVGSSGIFVWLDETGKQQELHAVPGSYWHPRLSPDNRRLAFDICTNGVCDIWVKDLERGVVSRLTFTPGTNRYPIWTPDGRAIVYSNSGPPGGLYWIPADGSGPAQRLSESDATPTSFSSDGKRLAFHMNPNLDVFIAPVEGDAAHPRLGKPEAFVATAATVGPQFSPDGRWIAYTSNESGRYEIYVRPLSGPGGRWQVSTGGGEYSRWDPKGSRLFYESTPHGIMVVPYTVSGNAFVPGKPRVWTPLHPSEGNGLYRWDVAADGKRLVIVKGADDTGDQKPQTELTFLLNFFDELKRKVK